MSKVIKGGGGPASPRIVDAARFDDKLQGAHIVDEARAQAERVVAEAKETAARLVEAARDEAQTLKRQGEAEGRERGLAAVTELLAGARAAAARARAGAEVELRTLAVRVAEKLLGQKLGLEPAAVVDIAAEALRHAGQPRELVVRCAPDDLLLLERGKQRLLDRCRAAQAVRFVGDERVARGGCIIETELGVVDARLSTQLDAIERALRGDSE